MNKLQPFNNKTTNFARRLVTTPFLYSSLLYDKFRVKKKKERKMVLFIQGIKHIPFTR